MVLDRFVSCFCIFFFFLFSHSRFLFLLPFLIRYRPCLISLGKRGLSATTAEWIASIIGLVDLVGSASFR